MSKELKVPEQFQTMSSLHIAELTGKEHNHVMRDIREHLERADVYASKFESTYINSQNKEQPCLNLPYNLALYVLLSMGNCNAKWRAVKSVIKRTSIQGLISLLEEMDLQDVPVDLFVYVAQEVDSGRFKIGISKHPDERIKQLNVGNPEQLEIVHAYLASEGFKSEKLIHKMFESNRIRGEWFDSKTEVKQIETKLRLVK